jgi:hypothetical protein
MSTALSDSLQQYLAGRYPGATISDLQFITSGWEGERILQAYSLAARKAVEKLDYFNVITYTKLVASTVISLRTGPEKLGMRPQTIESARQQASVLQELSRRIQIITGITVPEIETALNRIGGST